jgi:hypothetical protein
VFAAMLQSPTLAPETPCGLLSRLLVFIATVFCTRARTQLYELRAKDFKLELLPAGSRDYGGCWRLVLNETLSKTNQLKYATALAPVREPPFAIMDPNDESIIPSNNVVALYMRYTKKLPPVEQRKTDRFFLQPIAIEPAVRPLVVLLPCGYAPPASFDDRLPLACRRGGRILPCGSRRPIVVCTASGTPSSSRQRMCRVRCSSGTRIMLGKAAPCTYRTLQPV